MVAALAIILASIVATIALFSALASFRNETPDTPSLSIKFLGKTNFPVGGQASVFSLSNLRSKELHIWAMAWQEAPPYSTNSPPPHNTGVPIVGGDRLLRPFETQVILIEDSGGPSEEWRLCLSWSSGIRARIAILARNRPYLSVFGPLRVAPEYFEYSAPVRN